MDQQEGWWMKWRKLTIDELWIVADPSRCCEQEVDGILQETKISLQKCFWRRTECSIKISEHEEKELEMQPMPIHEGCQRAMLCIRNDIGSRKHSTGTHSMTSRNGIRLAVITKMVKAVTGYCQAISRRKRIICKAAGKREEWWTSAPGGFGWEFGTKTAETEESEIKQEKK